MKRIPLLIALIITLNACGGGGNPSGTPYVPSTPDDSDSSESSFWHKPPKGYNFDPMRIAFSGDYIYLSVSDHIMRTDGKEFKMLKNSYDDLDSVQFVDLHGRMYLYRSYSDDGFEFKKDSNYKGMNEYCADSLTAIICNIDDDIITRRTNKGFTYERIGLIKDHTKETLYQAEPGSNGSGTFVIPENDTGIFVSLDDGLNWKHILTNKSSFTAAAGNINHPAHIFAGRVGEMYSSSDTGVNWHKVNAPTDNGKRVVRWVDIELLDDGTLIALTEMENPTEKIQYLYKSNDFAKTWELVNKGKSYFQNIEGNDNFYFATGFIIQLHIAPR